MKTAHWVLFGLLALGVAQAQEKTVVQELGADTESSLKEVENGADAIQKTKALADIEAQHLTRPELNEKTARLAKELAKLFQDEKDNDVKREIARVIAKCGHAESVGVFISVMKTAAIKKDENFYASVRNFATTIQDSKQKIDLKSFRVLTDLVSAGTTPQAKGAHQALAGLVKAEGKSRENTVQNLNENKGQPTFPPGSIHKAKK